MPYRTAAWTLFGVMFLFKAWSVVLIVVYWGGSETVGFLLATHLLWFVIPAVLLWAPILFWVRLVRMRRRRQLLLDSEWNLEEHTTPRPK